MSMVDHLNNQTTLDRQAPPVSDSLHLLSAEIFSNLYRHLRESVVREYGANALDATKDSGSDAYVEITLPNPLEQNLVITDHGTGMTPHEAKVHWAAFGNSTKVDDPEFIGNIGAGAKSGFSLSTMILLETTKDGVTTTFNYTWFDGVGPEIVGETVEETGKPDGTTVTIPADPSGDWETEAKRAMLYTGSRVKINGEVLVDPRGENPPALHRMTPEEIDLMKGHRVVMAGANFRVPDVLIDTVFSMIQPGRGHMGHIVIEVPNKSLKFTPSREDVKDSDDNVEAIKQVIGDNYVKPINAQYLGDTIWQTYRNVGRTHEAGAAVAYVTQEIQDELQQVKDILADVNQHYGLMGVTYHDGTRGTWSGEPKHDQRFFRRYRRDTITDGISLHNLGTDDLMFVHSPEASIHRSPKVRQWVLDNGSRHMVITVADKALFDQIQDAGFATMQDAQMRKYKPTGYIPSAKRSAVRYETYDLYESRSGRSWRDGRKVSPQHIAEHYDAIYVKDYGSNVPMGRYLDFEQNSQLFKKHFGNQRIAVVELSAQASRDLAEERIGLPVVDLREVVDEFNKQSAAELPERYVRKIHMVNDLCGGRNGNSVSALKQLVSTSPHRFSYFRTVTQAMLSLLEAHDAVVELTGLEELAEIAEIRKVAQELTEDDWIDNMVASVDAQDQILTAEQQLDLAIDRAVTHQQQRVVSAEAAQLANKFTSSSGDKEDRKIIAGMIVNLAYDHLMADSQESAEDAA